MKRIVLFTTNKNYKIINYSNKYIIYLYIIELYNEIERLIEIMDIDDYVVESELEDLLENLHDKHKVENSFMVMYVHNIYYNQNIN